MKLGLPSICCCGLICIPALLGGGCGGAEEAGAARPAPGHMVILAVTPVQTEQRAEETNLLPNGEFEQWVAAAPAPDQFAAPDASFSSLTRRGGAAGYAAEQTWAKPDVEAPLGALFRAETPDMAPQTDYLLEVVAVTVAGSSANLSLYERGPAGAMTELAADFMMLMPGDEQMRYYAKPFTTATGGTLIIAAHANTLTRAGAQVRWYAWKLTKGKT
ncbi:MAG: hypothetical protein HYZ00_11510 [Candidatus Hydrogenedentes bacterium]|nr:hypothetical protein [Candidatus Hydrogenedentota bacterium]